MKRIIIATVGFILSLSSFAQDMIVKKDGSIIQAKVAKVGTTEVEYEKWSNQDGPSYAIAKSDILAITYQNGEKEMFEDIQSTQSATSLTTLDDYLQTKSNIEGINQINNAPFYISDNKLVAKKKDTEYVGMQYAVTKNSIVQTDILSVGFKFGREVGREDKEFRYYPERNHETSRFLVWGHSAVIVTLTNNSDKLMYVDLANSFLTAGQLTDAFYTPTATTTSSTSTSGGAFNLGGITNGLGIGGVVGSLANATTISGGNGTTSSKVVYSQRVLSIPPHSTIQLPYKVIQDDKFLYSTFNKAHGGYVPRVKLDREISIGEEVKFDESNSPYKFTCFITISFKEDFSEAKTSSTTLYCQKVLGIQKSHHIDGFRANKENLQTSEISLFSLGKL